MIIGIDIRCLMSENYSGVGWYAFNLLSALFEIDQKNEYVLFYNSSKKIKLPEFKGDNIRFVGYRWPNKLFNISVNFFSWPKLDRLAGGCNIFFAPNLHFVSWSNKCKKVITVHDLSFLAYPDWFTFKQRLWHKLILRKKILDSADVIIADSNSTKNDLIDLLKIPENKIKVAYLGAPHVEANGDALNKFNLPKKFFLFVGTIEPRKNLEGIIKALDGLPNDVKLVVAGDWGWKVNKSKVLRSIKSKEKIIQLGYISDEEKTALYESAVALVYPSFYEGFGLPILEAMANGCPVIAGNNSSQGEVLGDCGLLVDPFNVAEIRQAMEIMLNDENLRQKCIDSGLERAKEFTWQKTARQMLDIFEQI